MEASKKSAEALRKAQRESDEVFDNALKSVQDSDKHVHSITLRKDSMVLGTDGWSRDFRQAMQRVIAGIA